MAKNPKVLAAGSTDPQAPKKIGGHRKRLSLRSSHGHGRGGKRNTPGRGR